MQILANRLSLIMYNPVKERQLKVGLLIAIGVINVSVFCIWVHARLQISPTFIRLNDIWDRLEKAIFSVIDLALNTYFMWLVKSKLVSGGLTQYTVLYKYNLIIVCISISLDVSLPQHTLQRPGLTLSSLQILLIGIMSLPDDAVYAQRLEPSTSRLLLTELATSRCTPLSTSPSSASR
jgi:hypothetical protein